MPRLPIIQHPVLHVRNKYLHHKMKRTVFPEGKTEIRIGKIKFPCDMSLGKIAKSIYCGCFDFEIRRLIENILKPGDIFVDVGANMGYFSAVAANAVGPRGQVHCFEPVPKYAEYIQELIDLNPDYTIHLNRHALGNESSKATLYENRCNTGGHSLLKEYVGDLVQDAYEVRVERLDACLKQKQLRTVSLIKIDTEGYDFPVLLGLESFLSSTDRLPIMIAEISPNSFPMTGHRIEEFADYVRGYGYEIYAVCGCHKIDITKVRQQTNVVLRARK